MAVAALRNLATKIRIPGRSTLQALRELAPRPMAPLPPPPPPKGYLKNALLLKDKIESAEAKELLRSGDLIAKQCDLTEEIVSIASEVHLQVARSLRNVALRCFCTALVLGSIKSYYHEKREERVRRLKAHVIKHYRAAEGGLEVE